MGTTPLRRAIASELDIDPDEIASYVVAFEHLVKGSPKLKLSVISGVSRPLEAALILQAAAMFAIQQASDDDDGEDPQPPPCDVCKTDAPDIDFRIGTLDQGDTTVLAVCPDCEKSPRITYATPDEEKAFDARIEAQFKRNHPQIRNHEIGMYM